MKNALEYLGIGEALWTGAAHEYVLFTEADQLKKRNLWDQFVQVYTEDADDENHGWRCEYFGKMMRGACLTYMYHPDPELYEVLETAVRGLLRAQREDGRFSTYSTEHEFNGWDMWGRKYVLTGMMHFMRISHDEALNREILAALCRHADYIVEHIGNGEGQTSIFDTSCNWLGVNSCSILEPFVELYTRTGEQRYLDFAKYIISTGGCSGGDLVQLAIDDQLAPYQYPEVKAYETMSYFEGILAYYELTGEEKYLDAVLKFVEQVDKTDITIIGCSGCTHELFDNSAQKQTEFSDLIMQETCVTVTWIRLLSRLLLLTGNAVYADRIERAAYNALYGSVNLHAQNGKSSQKRTEFLLEPVTFDSYSPLYNGRRGKATGGLMRFRQGGFYGCCACIGSAGTALLPLGAVMKSENGIVINHPLAGKVETTLAGGQKLTLTATTRYPAEGTYRLELGLQSPVPFALSLRVPAWCKSATLTVNGEAAQVSAGYCTMERTWNDGDIVELSMAMTLEAHRLNGKTAYTYGALVMARDESKDGKPVDSAFAPAEVPTYTLEAPEGDETIRMKLACRDGELLLTDYASCGKYWTHPDANVSVWFNAVE